MVHWTLKIALTSLCLALTSIAQAAETSSPLIELDQNENWQAIGRIDIARSGYCTGALIARNLVLTAAHCVYNERTGKLYAAKDMVFYAGLHNGKAAGVARGKRIAVDRTYKPRDGTSRKNIRHDVALIQLSTPISNPDIIPFKLHSGVKAGNEVSVLSYGKGRSNALSRQRTCSILAHDNGVMAFNCNVTFGSSGSPVFAKRGGHNRILSVISSGGKTDGKVVAFGMDLPKIVARLRRDIDAGSSTLARTSKVRMLTVGQGKRTSGAKFIKN